MNAPASWNTQNMVIFVGGIELSMNAIEHRMFMLAVLEKHEYSFSLSPDETFCQDDILHFAVNVSELYMKVYSLTVLRDSVAVKDARLKRVGEVLMQHRQLEHRAELIERDGQIYVGIWGNANKLTARDKTDLAIAKVCDAQSRKNNDIMRWISFVVDFGPPASHFTQDILDIWLAGIASPRFDFLEEITVTKGPHGSAKPDPAEAKIHAALRTRMRKAD